METDHFWKLFESTGEVEAYLAYRQHGGQEEKDQKEHEDHNEGPRAARDENGRG